MATSPIAAMGDFAAENTQRNLAQANQNIVADQQRNTLPHSLAIKGLQDKLATIDQAKDPQAYQSTVDEIQGHVHAMREIFHPDARLGAGDWLAQHTTDKLHITNHDARVKALAAQNAAGVTQDQGNATALAQAVPPDAWTQYASLYQRATGQAPTEDVKTQWAQKQGGILPPQAATETEKFITQYQKDHPGATYEDATRAHTEATTKETAGGGAKLAAPLEAGGVMYGVRGPDGKEYLAAQMADPNTPQEVKTIWQTVNTAKQQKEEEARRKEEHADAKQMAGFKAIADRLGRSEDFAVKMATYRDQMGEHKPLAKAANDADEMVKSYDAQYANTPGSKAAIDTGLLTDYTSMLAKGGRKTQAEIALARNIGDLSLNAETMAYKAFHGGELPPKLREMYLKYIRTAAKTQREEADAAKPDPEAIFGSTIKAPQGPKTKALKAKQGGAKSLADRLSEALQ